jgi:hypothetical protein
MKKYALLLLLVLGLSSTALAACRVGVRVSQPTTLPPVCGEDVAIRATVCTSNSSEFVQFKQSQYGNIIYVDMYLKCTGLRGPTTISKGKWILRPAECGFYIVVVRVWMDYSNCCCWPYCMMPQPMLCGMGSVYFRVCCDDCCGPCCCW